MHRNNHLTAIQRLQQLKEGRSSSRGRTTSVSPDRPPVRPFGSVKSRFRDNPIQWMRQRGTEGDIHTEIHGSGLRRAC